MSIIAIGGGDLNKKIYNKIISTALYRSRNKIEDLYIGLITDASYFNKNNIVKTNDGFLEQQKYFPKNKINIIKFNFDDFKSKRI